MSYETTVLADTPVAYWTLNDPGTYTDATGHGYNLSSIGSTPTTTIGPVTGETAPLFSGSNGLYRSNTFSFTPYVLGVPQPWSAEFWYFGWGDLTEMLFWWGDNRQAQSADVICLRKEAFSSKIKLTSQNAFLEPTNGTGLDRKTWHHIVWTYNGTDYKYYLDGSDISGWATYVNNGALYDTPTDNALYLGYPPGGEVSIMDTITPTAAAIAHVAFYDYALTSTQVGNHHSAASLPSTRLTFLKLFYNDATTMDLPIIGVGFSPSSTVTISVDGVVAGTYVSDGSGTFGATDPDLFPPAVPVGYHLIEATDGTNTVRMNVLVTFAFLDTYTTISTTVMSSGDAAEVEGSNLIPSTTVSISVDSIPIGTTSTDPSGFFDYSLTLPTLSPGVHTIHANDGINDILLDIFIIYVSTASDSSVYRSEVMIDTPVAFLPLTESGSSYGDISGGATHAGTRINGATDTGSSIFSGETSPYLNFPGTLTSGDPIDYITLNNPTTLPVRNAFTYEIWASPQHQTGVVSWHGYVWSLDHLVDSTHYDWVLTLDFSPTNPADNVFVFNGNYFNRPVSSFVGDLELFFRQYSQGIYAASSKGEIWHHLVLTWDGNQMWFYLDGQPLQNYGGLLEYYSRYPAPSFRGIGFNKPPSSDVSVASLGGNSTGLYVEHGDSTWLGRLAYFASYDHALTPERVLCHWNAAVTGDACTPPPPPPTGQFAVLARVYRNQLVIHQNDKEFV